jgi:hypothetical protein
MTANGGLGGRTLGLGEADHLVRARWLVKSGGRATALQEFWSDREAKGAKVINVQADNISLLFRLGVCVIPVELDSNSGEKYG